MVMYYYFLSSFRKLISLVQDTCASTARKRRPEAFKALLLRQTSYFALKPLYDLPETAGRPEYQGRMERQLRYLKAIDDPRILSPLGTTVVNSTLHLVSPWQESGNLRQLLRKNQNIGMTERLALVRLPDCSRAVLISSCIRSEMWPKLLSSFTTVGASIRVSNS